MCTLNAIDRRAFLGTWAAMGAILIALVAGCATEQLPLRKAYDGADLGRDQIALIRSDQTVDMFGKRANWARFMAVDGKPLNGGWDGELAILPGPHTIRLRFTSDTSDPLGGLLGSMIAQGTEQSAGARTLADLSIEALAGHSYIVRYKVVGWLKVTYWIEDQGTGAVVAGLKPPP
jgi:hypothetical protein